MQSPRFENQSDCESYISHLESLLDSVLPAVEIFNAESPAQKEWKSKIITEIRKVTERT